MNSVQVSSETPSESASETSDSSAPVRKEYASEIPPPERGEFGTHVSDAESRFGRSPSEAVDKSGQGEATAGATSTPSAPIARDPSHTLAAGIWCPCRLCGAWREALRAGSPEHLGEFGGQVAPSGFEALVKASGLAEPNVFLRLANRARDLGPIQFYDNPIDLAFKAEIVRRHRLRRRVFWTLCAGLTGLLAWAVWP